MTRHDVANLVVRTFSLWLGVQGIAALTTLPWLASMPGQPAPELFVLGSALGVPLVAAVVLWLLAPRLAAAAFDRTGDPAPFAITAAGVPPLASFVVGLVTLAGVVPQGIAWLAMQIARGQAHASLMDSNLLPEFDQQSAGAGAEIVARLIVGAVLIALSRRPGIWAIASDVDTDDAPAETE